MRFKDRKIHSVGELVAALKKHVVASSPTWFRGQERSSWTLVPSIGRNAAHLAAELTSIKKFKQDAWSHLPNRPAEPWEWMFTMQHYRAKTRLLDWSESPLVALYFSTQHPDEDGEDGAVWCLDPVALNKEAGHVRAFEQDILAFGADRELEAYLPDQVDAKVAKLNPVAAIGPRNSPRMVAQAGTFTIMHTEPTAIEAVGKKQHVWRYIVDKASKPTIRKELKLIGVSEYTLFPELDRVADIAAGLFA